MCINFNQVWRSGNVTSSACLLLYAYTAFYENRVVKFPIIGSSIDVDKVFLYEIDSFSSYNECRNRNFLNIVERCWNIKLFMYLKSVLTSYS